MSRFDWDPVKAEANFRKHGVTFDEAGEMLETDECEERPDARHSLGEGRVRTIGYAPGEAVIVVITSTGGRRPRIISAQRATKRECDEYVG